MARRLLVIVLAALAVSTLTGVGVALALLPRDRGYVVFTYRGNGSALVSRPTTWHAFLIPTLARTWTLSHMRWTGWGRSATTGRGKLTTCPEQAGQCKVASVTIRLSHPLYNITELGSYHEYCWLTVLASSDPYVRYQKANTDITAYPCYMRSWRR